MTSPSLPQTARARKLAIPLALLLAAGSGFGAEIDAKALFNTKCAKCHGETGAGNPKALETVCEGVDPAKLKLAGIGKRSDAEIRKQILDGSADMPAYREKLTAEQVDALLAHLRTLVPTPAAAPAAK